MFLNGILSSLTIKDGGKRKISRFGFAVLALPGILIVICVQLLSTVQTKSRAGEAIEAPKISVDSPVSPPQVVSGVEVERASMQRRIAEKMRAMTFQPLKSVTLQPKLDVPIGSEVSAQLSSGGSNGTVTAYLDSSVEADGDVILPKGTLLYGKGNSSDERLYISFATAVFPDKKRMKVKASAFDQNDRMEGLKGKKISDYAFKFAASAGLFFLGGLADGMREDNYSNPFAQRKPSVKDAALNGVSTATLETGKNMLQKMNEEKSRIEVKATTKILVIFGDPSETQ